MFSLKIITAFIVINSVILPAIAQLDPIEAEAILFVSTDFLNNPNSQAHAVGNFQFRQIDGVLNINGVVVGLNDPISNGFHIQPTGDFFTGCGAVHDASKPASIAHEPTNTSDRLVGVIPVINTDNNGVSVFSITESQARLDSANSIIGRGVVVHLGSGVPERMTYNENQSVDAGGRYACGVVSVKTQSYTSTTQHPVSLARALLFTDANPLKPNTQFTSVGFVQLETIGSEVHITGRVTGLTPGLHGFHVHQLGTYPCTATLSHFNPTSRRHGSPNVQTRHIGDLGNIEANLDGLAIINITDNMVKLFGTNSVLGRSFVVHLGTDDLGLGTANDSRTTGNAGGRYACGVVGIAEDKYIITRSGEVLPDE